MGGRSDDSEREQRLSALRALAAQMAPDAGQDAGRAAPQSADAPNAPDAPDALMDELDDADRSGGRRWRLALAVGLAALLVVALGTGYALRRGSTAHAITTAPTLTARTFSMSAAGGVFCTTTPAWAPDSQRFAVLGQTNRPQDSCEPYNSQVSIAQLSGGQNVPYVSVNQAEGYALVIFDSAHGAVTQRITLPTPDSATLCGAWKGCSIAGLAPQSLAWTPDGHTVAVFFTYATLSSAAPQSMRENGGLALFPVGVANAQPRLLLAAGPAQPAAAGGSGVSPLVGLVAQRFTWNISTGVGTATAIPQAPTQALSTDTIAFAPAWQWSAGGALSPVSAPATGATGGSISPWASGVVGLRQIATTPALYRTSQWVWSSDGKYVIPNLATSVYLRLPGAQVPAAPSSSYWPASAEAPDTATSAAIAAGQPSSAGVALARSPDGALLAAYSCASNPQIAKLSISASKTADPVAQATYTYPYSLYSLACTGDIDTPVWSPNGQRLAVGDEQDAQVTVWRLNARVSLP
ncbi:MAG TPA: hypothetical protein VF725_05880 [Ktedonobacterales bacterium]